MSIKLFDHLGLSPTMAGLCFLLVSTLIVSSAAAAGIVEDLPARQWIAVPNSDLDSSGEKPAPLPGGASGFGALMSAWNSGVFDSLRNRLCVHGGGHNDYYGNGIYCFDLDTLSWQRVWGPDPLYEGGQDMPPVPDAEPWTDQHGQPSPNSVHTYDDIEYFAEIDSMWRGYGVCSPSGSGCSTSWLFDFGVMTTNPSPWAMKQPVAYYTTTPSAYDSVTKKVYFTMSTNSWTRLYEVDTNGTIAQKGSTGVSGIYHGNDTAEIDEATRKFLVTGLSYDPPVADWYVWDLDSWTHSVPTLHSSCSTVASARAPGLAWYPPRQRIIAWVGGNSIWEINTSNWTCTEIQADSGSAVPGAPASAGTFGRFRYSPNANVFIVVNRVNENVFLYRLDPGGGILPDTTAPAPPSHLEVR